MIERPVSIITKTMCSIPDRWGVGSDLARGAAMLRKGRAPAKVSPAATPAERVRNLRREKARENLPEFLAGGR
jgi:hypothetical protein